MYLSIIKGAVELGIIYAVLALGVFLSFRVLDTPDLTVDGSFVLGAAVSAVLCTLGHPLLGIPLAFLAGCMAGGVTSILSSKFKIQPLLAGILTMLSLYSVNLRAMRNKANIPLNNVATIFSYFDGTALKNHIEIILSLGILMFISILLFLFLNTKVGLDLRATGDNEQMVKALGVNTDTAKFIGLAVSNGLVGVSGALAAQYNSFADIGMGTGTMVIGLASVIIGEVVFGCGLLYRRLAAAMAGAVLYRLVIAFAFELGVPATDLKLISAVIVAAALSMASVKERLALLEKRRAPGLKAKEGGILNAEN
ncbi:MAG: ABC transporter permease [Clostridia bacterium]|nr:ABC transporter permease [Clostridiales bacterium]